MPTTAFVTQEHWLEREIDQSVRHEGSIRRPITPRENALPRSYISLQLLLTNIRHWPIGLFSVTNKPDVNQIIDSMNE